MCLTNVRINSLLAMETGAKRKDFGGQAEILLSF